VDLGWSPPRLNRSLPSRNVHKARVSDIGRPPRESEAHPGTAPPNAGESRRSGPRTRFWIWGQPRLLRFRKDHATVCSRAQQGHDRNRRKASKRAAFHITFLDLPGEQIPLADQSIDTVVTTFTLCTVADFEKVICGIARVLRPKGRLIFIENTLSPDQSVQRWQKLWAAPLYHVFSGLDLTRDIPGVLQAGTFRLDELHTGYLSAFPKSWTHCCWGIATRRHDLGT